jgi:hypothetical protein
VSSEKERLKLRKELDNLKREQKLKQAAVERLVKRVSKPGPTPQFLKKSLETAGLVGHAGSSFGARASKNSKKDKDEGSDFDDAGSIKNNPEIKGQNEAAQEIGYSPSKQASIILAEVNDHDFYAVKQPDLSLQALNSKTAMSRIFEMNNIMQRLTNEGMNDAQRPRRSLLDSFLYNPHGSNSMMKHFNPNLQSSFLKLFPSNYETQNASLQYPLSITQPA